MGTLYSDSDLSGTVVNGVLLAEGTPDEVTGQFMWDHSGIPDGEIVPDPFAVWVEEEVPSA